MRAGGGGGSMMGVWQRGRCSPSDGNQSYVVAGEQKWMARKSRIRGKGERKKATEVVESAEREEGNCLEGRLNGLLVV